MSFLRSAGLRPTVFSQRRHLASSPSSPLWGVDRFLPQSSTSPSIPPSSPVKITRPPQSKSDHLFQQPLSIPLPNASPPPPPVDPFTRWSNISSLSSSTRLASAVKPGNPYTGRTVDFEPGTASRHLNRLNGIVSRNNIKNEVRRLEWFEPNPVKRWRLRRSRWMRRFAVAMRQNVQTVFHLRLRNQSPAK